MDEKIIKSDRGSVYYWISGAVDEQRDTLFFLHGLTGDHNLFEKQIEHFKNDYNIIAWDAPMHGRSRPYRDFSYPNAIEDMKQILDDNHIEKVILIGQSLGGYFSQSFIRSYPEKVKGFVSIDSTPYGEIYYSKSDRFWLRQVEWMSHLYPYKMMQKAIANQVSTTQYAYENMLSMLQQYPKNELCHLMGIGYASLLDDLSDMEIPCPVLLILGEKDKTGKVKTYNREWTKRTGYPLIIIKNASHNSNADNPEEVNDAIANFIMNP